MVIVPSRSGRNVLDEIEENIRHLCVIVPSRSGRNSSASFASSLKECLIVPSRSGRNTVNPSMMQSGSFAHRPLKVGSELLLPQLRYEPLRQSSSPQGRVGTGQTVVATARDGDVIVPSRSGRNVAGRCAMRGVKYVIVPSRSGRNDLALQRCARLYIRSSSPQGRVGTKAVFKPRGSRRSAHRPLKVGSEHQHSSSPPCWLLAHRPLKVGSEQLLKHKCVLNYLSSSSPQGRVGTLLC